MICTKILSINTLIENDKKRRAPLNIHPLRDLNQNCPTFLPMVLLDVII